jgi:hypothetical protein
LRVEEEPMLEQNYNPEPIDAVVIADEHDVQKLEARLHRGWTMIEEREAAGKPTDHLIEHFLELLHEYEAAYRLARVA